MESFVVIKSLVAKTLSPEHLKFIGEDEAEPSS
jgi:hypothetical protein